VSRHIPRFTSRTAARASIAVAMHRARSSAFVTLALAVTPCCSSDPAAQPDADTSSTSETPSDTTDTSSPTPESTAADSTTSDTPSTPPCDPTALVTDACTCGASECATDQWCDLGSESCIAATCNPGTVWTPGTEAFVEITAGSNLLELAVEGTRLNIVDIDADGFPDLFVRRGGVAADVPDESIRNAWLLRNTEGTGFEDVTFDSGILARRDGDTSRGRPVEIVASADVDNDGDLDIYTGINNSVETAEGEGSEILLAQGDGTYVLGPEDSDLRRVGVLDVPAGAAFIDANLDGNIDLWVTQNETAGAGVQDRLYYGDGTGMFHDGTTVSGLTTQAWSDVETLNAGLSHTRSWSAVACDLNDDGWPELLSASYGRSPNHLWQAVPTSDEDFPQFLNRAVDSGYAYDGNQTWTDNQFAACFCSANPDEEGCVDAVTPQISCMQQNWNHGQDREAFRLGGNSGATVCADIDNDGALDLWTSEIRHWWAGEGADHSELLVNTGLPDVMFDRPGRESMGVDVPHVTGNSWDEGHMSANVLDFDNDGWKDIYVGASDYPGNTGLLLHQDAPLSFSLVPSADAFEHNRSHGVVTADFDRDGDLDLVAGHSRSRCDANAPNDCYPTGQVRIFDNVLGAGGQWIQLELVGDDGSNVAGIGARVEIEAAEITQTQEIGGGFGHFGAQNDRLLHFGLADACTARVTVRWPDAALTEQTFELPAGHRYRITHSGAITLAD
jgi:hypothetical protein